MAKEDGELDLTGGAGAGDDDAKKNAGGDDAKKRGRGRPSSAAKTRDLETAIREGLEEIAALLEERNPESEMAESLRTKADAQAKVLATWAAKGPGFVGAIVGKLFGPLGIVGILRAFGPTFRAGAHNVADWRERRGVEYVADENDIREE